jgi:hypothetical protein
MYDDAPVPSAPGRAVDIPSQTLTERLHEERRRLGARLQELDAAISALEANPQIQLVFDLVQKVARY